MNTKRASGPAKPADAKPAGSATNNDAPKPSPFKISDEQIKEQIFKAHGNDGTLAADSLFPIVVNILKRSTQIVDDLVKGYAKVPPAKTEDTQNVPTANINIPICTLKDIRFELSCCKDPQPETAHERTLKILTNLKAYSWEATAVLTLAAFSSEFGDFWLLVELEKSNHNNLSKSLAILKGAPNLTSTAEILQARKTAVIALNDLIKDTLELTDIIFQLENLSSDFPIEIAKIPKETDIYWIMIAVIACGSKVAILTSTEEIKPLDLSPYADKIKAVLTTRKGKLTDLLLKKAEGAFYSDLVKVSKIRTKDPEFLAKLFFGKDYADDNAKLIIDASNNCNKVGLNVLTDKTKTLFILVSYLDIFDDDLDILKLIQNEKIAKDQKLQEQYGIVWMPIVDENQPEYYQKMAKDIVNRARTNKMEGFVVKPVSHQATLKFLKKEWNFKGSPIVAVKDEDKGIYVNRNTFYTISILGLEAFPFDKRKETEFINAMKWMIPLFKDYSDVGDDKLSTWVKMENNYIFIFGGKDKTGWAKDMKEKRETMLKVLNPDRTKGTFTIKLLDVEQNLDTKERFWKRLEGLFITKINHYDDRPKQQIQRLYSYKNEERGWFALNKGDETIIVGNRTSFSKMMDEFHKWSGKIRPQEFEVAFRDYHEKTLTTLWGQMNCSRVDIPKNAPKVKEGIKCPECDHEMEMSIRYNCCHNFSRVIPILRT